MRKRTVISCVAIAFLFVSLAHSQVTTGTISGTVTDSSGAAIPDAQVMVLNEDTGISRTVLSNAAGRYSAPQLSVGRFRITTTKEGFQAEVRSGIQLTVGREAVVNVQLQVGQVTQTVEVTGEAPLVQTTDAALSYLVNDRTITELPLNGRDISQLILLNPGVIQSANGQWGNADKGFGKRFSISGMRGEDNSYLLDGSYINDYYRHVPAGPSGALTGVETVREFQMLTASFSAQYGRALGGVFNAITKSGTNEWHGSAYEFLRNNVLDARNFFDRQSSPSDPRLPPFRRNQFGATLGGPIFRDKTFFFVAYEGLRESLTRTVISNIPDLNARQGILPGVPNRIEISPQIVPLLGKFPDPSPGGRNFGDGTAQFIFPGKQPTRDDFGQARIDHHISEQDTVFGRFTGSNAQRATVNGYPDRFQVSSQAVRLFTLSETHVFSPRLLNSVRLSFSRVVPLTDQIVPRDWPEQFFIPGQVDPMAIEAGSGTTRLGGTENPGGFFTTNRFALNDDVNLTLGAHSLVFGGLLERLQYNSYIPFRTYGEWRFDTIRDFLIADPNRYRGTPPQFSNARRGFRQWFLALYLQDDWRVTANLTLNIGLRWEPYTVPTEVNGLTENIRHLTDPAPTFGDPYWKNQSWQNFSPRAGFAWSPSSSGKTSVRGGFGLFFVPVDSAYYTAPISRGTALAPRISINDPDPRLFPDVLSLIASAQASPAGTQDIFGLTFENLKSSRALQYSLNVQQQIGENDMFTFGYSGRRGLNLPTIANWNMPLYAFNGRSLEAPANARRFNSNYRQVNYVSNNSNSWYNGLILGWQRRFAAGLQAQVSYTFSRTIGEADGADGNHVGSGGTGSLKYPHDLSASKGLSGYHLKNVLSISHTYDLPFGNGMSGVAGHLLSGWQLSGLLSFNDGQPFWVTATVPRAIADDAPAASPNLVPGFTSDEIVIGSPDGYFTLDAFTPPGPRELGNLGRNTLIGPGLANWDFGLTKNTQLNERWRLQFRMEAFNLLNRANFASPGQTGSSGSDGFIFTRAGGTIPSSTLLVSTATTARQIQFGLKLMF